MSPVTIPRQTGDVSGKHSGQGRIAPLPDGDQRRKQDCRGDDFQSELVANAKFRLLKQPDGSYAIHTPNGFNVVTADNGGGLAHGTPQIDNLITTKAKVQDWEKFRFAEVSTGLYTIQTVSGFYIAVKNDFTNISTRISFPDEAPSIGYIAKFELIMTSI